MNARRYLFWFFAIAGAIVILIFFFNLLARNYILHSPVGASVQMASGFERVIKPAWLAGTKPSMVFVGSSRARTAYDPTLIRQELHIRSFNYGVSSETAYEARRYIQDAAAQPSVKTIVVALDAFAAGTEAKPFGAGFDNLRLAVTPQGTPTRRRGLWLFTTRYLSGGALGMHALGLWMILRLHDGQEPRDRPDIFTAYEHMTPKTFHYEMVRRENRTMRLNPWRLKQLKSALASLCTSRARVYFYFPSDNFALIADYLENDAKDFLDYKKVILAQVERHNSHCPNNVRLFDFMNLNRITADMSAAYGRPSPFYRDPIHVRPPTGIMLLKAMLGVDKPGTEDPGVELTSNPGARKAIDDIYAELARWKAQNPNYRRPQ